MIGKYHSATGGLVGAAVVPPLELAGWRVSGVALVAWVALSAVGALLPDLDEPQSIAGRRSLGLAHVVRWLADGHREGTHDAVLAPLSWLALTSVAAWGAHVLLRAPFVPWLGVPVALGVLVGILGDALTVDGVPVPFTWHKPGRAPRWGLRLFRSSNELPNVAVTVICGAATLMSWRYL